MVWLRSKGRKVEAEAHICGSGGSGACGWLSIAQLHLKTLCMWVEESLKHLEGIIRDLAEIDNPGAISPRVLNLSNSS